MARHKEANDIVRRERLSRTELELWPLYSDIQFEDWVKEIIDCQPEEDEIERPDVIKDKAKNAKNPGGRNGKGEIVIDGVAYKNAFQACKSLGVSGNIIYKWLKEGRAIRLSELPVVINGREFKSIEDAAKRLGVSIDVINKWIELNI